MALRSPLFSSNGLMATLVRSGFDLRGPTSEIYDQEAFQYMLTIERKRARFAKTSLLLLLIRIADESGSTVHIRRAIARVLFTGLGHCFREVDFVGWLRQERVAGAVLAQGSVAPGDDALPRIVDRVSRLLSRRLPLATAQRLDVRVIRLGRGLI
jgi:hypothetical protein